MTTLTTSEGGMGVCLHILNWEKDLKCKYSYIIFTYQRLYMLDWWHFIQLLFYYPDILSRWVKILLLKFYPDILSRTNISNLHCSLNQKSFLICKWDIYSWNHIIGYLLGYLLRVSEANEVPISSHKWVGLSTFNWL